jgi:hypothetical protein
LLQQDVVNSILKKTSIPKAAFTVQTKLSYITLKESLSLVLTTMTMEGGLKTSSTPEN